jgi:hypothetical protein
MRELQRSEAQSAPYSGYLKDANRAACLMVSGGHHHLFCFSARLYRYRSACRFHCGAAAAGAACFTGGFFALAFLCGLGACAAGGSGGGVSATG